MAENSAPKVIVLGMMSKIPVAGVIWQTLHYLVGFERLGLEAYYVEAHARTPSMLMTKDDDDSGALAADFIGRVLTPHGLQHRWAFQALHADTRCYGLSDRELHGLYRDAALIINLHGGTQPLHEHTVTGRLVYLETDPVQPQIELFEQVPETIDFLDQHCAHFTFAENYGSPECTLPITNRYTFHHTRQPVVVDWWESGLAPVDGCFTTVANWHQPWRNVSYDGRVYGWSKDEQFRTIINLPAATSARLEVALSNCKEEDQAALRDNGWRLRSARDLSADVDSYRRFIQGSRGEFSVAKEQNVAFRTGWFSDRSATYLAAGRPVVMQDTGFGQALPTGRGLLAFSTPDQAAAALEKIQADYPHHAAGAHDLARSHFSHEVVLGTLLDTLDVRYRGTTHASRRMVEQSSVGASGALSNSLVVSAVSKRPLCLDSATIDALSRRRKTGICVPSNPTAGRPDVSIVVPVHNRVDLTQLCLESMLSSQSTLAYEVIVVNDGSTDETSAYLGMLANAHVQVSVIANPERRGFSYSVNRGIAASLGRFIVVANNDTIVAAGWMAGLIAHLDDPSVGMVVASTAAHSRNCRVPAEYRTYGELQHLAGERLAAGHSRRMVPMAPLFFAALRRKVVDEIGPLDEQFEVAMFEDDDYCERLQQAGYVIVCALDVFVHHYGEGTLGSLYPQGAFHQIFDVNRTRFERKWNVVWSPTESHDDPSYQAEVGAIRALLNAAVPDGDVVAVVSRGDEALVALDGPVGWHVPHTETGAYRGAHPADSEEAIADLEAARAAGAGWLFLPRQSGWWLDYYDRLGPHLTAHAHLARDEECGWLYRLNPPADPETSNPDPTHSRTASACTIISRNYLGQARVLARSYLDHHPQGRFYLLILDGLPSGAELDDRIILVDLADLPLDDLGDMCFKYDVVELATAVKPALLMLLMESFAEQRIMYIDPDILVTRPLTEVFEALDDANIVLTPHLNAPIPLDGHTPREQDILISGAYNLGFIAIRKSNESLRLLVWWRERLNDLCRVDPANGLMVDQRWIDLVPSLFPSTHILHDDAYNVAYWNLHARHIELNGDSFACNGRPLAMFHFSGYNPEHPDRISKHQTRTQLEPGSDLRTLFDLYGQAMLEAGFLESKEWGYGLATFDNGIGLHTIFRRLYRDLGDERRRFGDPLAAGGDHSFFSWATTADPDRRNLSPFLEMAYRLRYDIQGAFPDVGGADRVAFLAWAVGQGASEFGFEPEVAERCEPTPDALPPRATSAPHLPIETAPKKRSASVTTPPGVNVCGYLRNESGLGAAARSYIRILEHLDVPLALLDVSELSVNRSEDRSISSFHHDYTYPVNLVCINADQHFVVMNKNPEFFVGKYNIGVWFWELPSFPPEWHDRFAHYDEIWVGSSYIANTLTPVSPIPVVRIMPVLGSQAPGDRVRGRSTIGADDEFVFLFMFDFNSYIERKNPLAVIEAFRLAFPATERAKLVVKSVNGSSNTAGLASIESAAHGDDRIILLNDYVSAGDIADLTSACDCYVSLHRAEGSGLTMAHAMAAGKPVIATGWSGNTDFMDSSNSLLVRFDLVELERDIGPYKLGGTWADPDVVHASALMRHVFDNPDEAAALGATAEQSITTRFSAEQVGRAAAERLRVVTQRLECTPRFRVPISPENMGNVELMTAIRHIVKREVSDERPVVVVSKGDPVLVDLGDRTAWHYPQNEEGVYAGYYPNDSATAISHLEQLRDRGAGYFLVPATCRWWLDHYRELRHHLDSQYCLAAEDACCMLYRLDSATTAKEPTQAHLDDLSAQIQHLNATLAATGEWVADLAPRVAATHERIEAMPEILRTAFTTVAEAITDVEGEFDGRIETIERSHDRLTGEITATRAVLDEFALHVETSRRLTDARQGQLAAKADVRMDELSRRSSDQINRLGTNVAGLAARLGAIGGRRALGVRSATRTLTAGSPEDEHKVLDPGTSGLIEVSMEVSQSESGGSDAAAAVNIEQRLAARPYMSSDRFWARDPDHPLGFTRTDGREEERAAKPTFADVFRGEESFITERQRIYLPFFADCERVVDLGSGRGEFLDLLAETGIKAEGVELDGSLVRACRRRGLAVRQQDALAFLDEIDPASLDGVFSAQFIEHVHPSQLGDTVVLARRALREGGMFIAETVNPENFEAFKTFHVDLTHQRPIFPQVLLQLCWEAGFEAAWIFYPLGGGFSQREFDAVGEYAVVARA